MTHVPTNILQIYSFNYFAVNSKLFQFNVSNTKASFDTLRSKVSFSPIPSCDQRSISPATSLHRLRINILRKNIFYLLILIPSEVRSRSRTAAANGPRKSSAGFDRR